MTPAMRPAGYLYKTVAARPDGAGIPDTVTTIASVSGCISKDFADYTNHWLHNGHWFFDHPQPMHAIAAEDEIDLSGMTLFYYEIYDRQFDDHARAWTDLDDTQIPVAVAEPAAKTLLGFDVVSYSQRHAPECSPLSCNGLAQANPVNANCLFATIDDAKAALEAGRFEHSEPGPYRILAVYTVS